MGKLNVGVIFGGRSVEHEVSVLTAHQAMAGLPTDQYDVTPIYIAKSGTWFIGDGLRDLTQFTNIDRLISTLQPVLLSTDPVERGQLRATGHSTKWWGKRSGADLPRIDVAFPVVHGSHGEDGTLQGLFELCDLPYVGCGVAASAIGMDKALAKSALRGAGLPVLDDMLIQRRQWTSDVDEIIANVEGQFPYPVYVKPATLGSSIGVSRASDQAEFRAACDAAFAYDSRVLIELAQDNAVDINCSVLGRAGELEVSVCEQPVRQGTLTYEDKYMRGGSGKGGSKGSGGKGMQSAQRIIPAPLSETLTVTIQRLAEKAFLALGAEGVVRIDFLVDSTEGRVVLNEVNTIPGSLSFYLWEPMGLSFPDLLTKLIDMAVERTAEKRRSTFSIDSWLLTHATQGAGAKGA